MAVHDEQEILRKCADVQCVLRCSAQRSVTRLELEELGAGPPHLLGGVGSVWGARADPRADNPPPRPTPAR